MGVEKPILARCSALHPYYTIATPLVYFTP